MCRAEYRHCRYLTDPVSLLLYGLCKVVRLLDTSADQLQRVCGAHMLLCQEGLDSIDQLRNTLDSVVAGPGPFRQQFHAVRDAAKALVSHALACAVALRKNGGKVGGNVGGRPMRLTLDAIKLPPTAEAVVKPPKPPSLAVGNAVVLVGLKARADLNGKLATLLDFKEKTQRWQVALGDYRGRLDKARSGKAGKQKVKCLMVRAANLTLLGYH